MLPSVALTTPQVLAGEFLTRPQAATVLRLSPNTVGKLLASGFLPDLAAARVHALARAPQISVTRGELPVLRTGPAGPPPHEDDDREFIGDAPHLTDEQFLEASRQWWRCEPDKVVAAGVLAVAVAGWVTGVLAVRGRGGTRHGGRDVRHSFEASVAGRVTALDHPDSSRVLTGDPALAALTRTLLGARVQEARSGGPIAYLKAPPQPPRPAQSSQPPQPPHPRDEKAPVHPHGEKASLHPHGETA